MQLAYVASIQIQRASVLPPGTVESTRKALSSTGFVEFVQQIA